MYRARSNSYCLPETPQNFDEITLQPGRVISLLILYNPKNNSNNNKDYNSVRLQRHSVRTLVKCTDENDYFVKTFVINSRICTSILSVTPSVLDLKNCNIDVKKNVDIYIINHVYIILNISSISLFILLYIV